MLGHLVEHTKLRLTIAATHYGGRALVTGLFLIAAAFGVAAVFVLIAQEAGAVAACVTMAIAFLLLAIVLAMIMASRERTQQLAMRQAVHNSAMSASFASMLPQVFAGGLLSQGRRVLKTTGLGRPLVLGSVLVALLFAMKSRSGEDRNTRV